MYASRISTTLYRVGHINPIAHQARDVINPNYVAAIKQDINKLLLVKFIQPTKDASWLSPIVVIPRRMESS